MTPGGIFHVRSSRRRTWQKVVAVTTVLAFSAAACGDDDEDEGTADTAATGNTTATTGATADTTDEATADTTEETTAETTDDATADTTEETTEETTGESDDTTADTATDDTAGTQSLEGVGLIDGIYTGVGGFEIDPAECPEDWDPMQGITDEEIKLFVSLPTSGPFAGFGLIADGAKSYFQYVNDNGGIDGRNIVLDAKDDGYAPDKTKTNVDEAIQSGEYAALFGVLGTPNNLAVWDNTNDECMPHLLNATGAPQWGDVENHPWTTGMQIDYFTEAQLWAEWLKAEHPDAKSVAMITFNNDFGKLYSSGFKTAIEDTELEVVAEELHEPTAPNLTNQFTSLASTNADVLLIQTSGAFCTQAMSEIEKGGWKPIVIMSGTCASLSQFFQPLIDQGLTGEGTYLIQYLRDVNDEANADDPFVQLYHETVTAQGLDSTQSTYATGWVFAWYMTEFLRLASTMEGGLDRGNIMLANRALDKPMPLLYPGITNTMNGMEDAYLNEGGVMNRYEVEDPTRFGTFVQAGDLINNEGELGTYANVQELMGG
jgi:branched-chain amino acid transport system substrate-binding protein